MQEFFDMEKGGEIRSSVIYKPDIFEMQRSQVLMEQYEKSFFVVGGLDFAMETKVDFILFILIGLKLFRVKL